MDVARNECGTPCKSARTTNDRVHELQQEGCSRSTIDCFLSISSMINNCIRSASTNTNREDLG